jgi:hypothetical protein
VRKTKPTICNSAKGERNFVNYLHTATQGPLLHGGTHGAGLKKGLCAQEENSHTRQWVIRHPRKHSGITFTVVSDQKHAIKITPPITLLPWQRFKMAPTTSKKFYAMHGTHKGSIFTKWFGKGGA